MLIKKNFGNFLVRIILDNECNTNVNSLLCNKTYPFMYDMKIIEPR